jgi:hypothetical protein
MAGKKISLYVILKKLAVRQNSPYINPKTWKNFIHRIVDDTRKAGQPLQEWDGNTDAKIMNELATLEMEKKISSVTQDGVKWLYIPYFYSEMVDAAWSRVGTSCKIPFPTLEGFNIQIPDDQMVVVNDGNDLESYFGNKHEPTSPVTKLVFVDLHKHLLTLPRYMPDTLITMALTKISDFVNSLEGADYISKRIQAGLKGSTTSINLMVKKLLEQPETCVSDMQTGGEFTYQFFLHLYAAVKMMVNDEIVSPPDGPENPERVTLFQSIGIVLLFASFYYARVTYEKNKEKALETAYTRMIEPPYCFTHEQIVKLQDDAGNFILEDVTKEELDTFLKSKLNSGTGKELPELMLFHGHEGQYWYVRKGKVLNLATSLLARSRAPMNDVVKQHFDYLIRNYRSAPELENDTDFEKYLAKACEKIAPNLLPIIRDNKVMLLEMENSKGDKKQPAMYFAGKEPVPLRTLFLLQRSEIIDDVRESLPFWYSVPLLVLIIRFFKYGRRKKVKKHIEETSVTIRDKKQNHPAKENTLKRDAGKLMKDMLPKDKHPDDYLSQMVDRWNHMLNQAERSKLTKDVNSLIRDYMRYVSRVESTLTADELDGIASRIILTNPSMNQIKDKESLKKYIKMFILDSILK